MTRVLVTGASGFVGSFLCPLLAGRGYAVRAALRRPGPLPAGAVDSAIVGELAAQTDWTRALDGVELVVHLAARAHRVKDGPGNAARYLQVNAEATGHLARAAAQRGVRRFVFLSTVKVNGEESGPRPFSSADTPRPQGSYARSKWQGEQLLAAAAREGGMPQVVVRAPLVYGPGVRANFLRLLHWVDREVPLPLGAVHNRRSLVSAWNLCDLLACLLEHPSGPGRTWMVCDGNDLSTAELVRELARLMGRRARLVAVPPTLLRLVGTVVGRRQEIRRLCGSLTVDATATRELLQWRPPVSTEEALARTVSWYRTSCTARA